jgi:predicted RND superfamily exporter protein/PAS domain-containing protein
MPGNPNMEYDSEVCGYLDVIRRPAAIICQGIILYANPTFLALWQGPPPSLRTVSFLELFPTTDRTLLASFFKLASSTKESDAPYPELEAKLQPNTGTPKACTLSAYTLQFKGQKALCVYFDEKQVALQKELKQTPDPAATKNQEFFVYSDSNFQVIRRELSAIQKPAAIVYHGIFLYANYAFLELLGYQSFSDIEDISVIDLHPELDEQVLANFLTMAEGTDKSSDTYPQIDTVIQMEDGTRKECRLSGYSPGKNSGHTICFFVDETSQEVVEPALTAEEKTPERPWKLYATIVCLLLLSTIPTALNLGLNINNSPSIYLPPGAPAVVIDNKLRENFPSDQGLVLLFEGVALFSNDFLIALDSLTETLSAHEKIDKVSSVTSMEHISGSDDGFNVEPLIDIDQLEDSTSTGRKELVLKDRFANKLLVSEDGSALAMAIFPVEMDNSFERLQLQDEIIDLVEEHNMSGYLTAVAGYVTTDVEHTRSLLRELITFIPLTVITGLLLIWFLFRRPIAVLASLIAIGATVNSSVAFYVLFDQPFNMISSILPPMLSALTIAALVHIFNGLLYASNRGLRGAERVSRALSEVRRPAFYTALTTMAGFLSLGFSPIPPISTFGFITAVGVSLIYIVVYHLLPPIFAQFDTGTWPNGRTRRGLMDKLIGALFHLGVRRPVLTILGITVLLGAFASNIRNIEVETNMQEFFSPDHKTRIAGDHIQEKLVGLSSLDIIFETDDIEGLVDPLKLSFISDFQLWAESQPEIDKSLSMADFIEDMNWGFHSQDNNFRKVPDEADLISQYLFVYDGEDLYNFVDNEFQTSHVSLNVNVHGANDISQLMARIRGYLQQNAPEELNWDIAGGARMFADQEDLLIEGQINSVLGALALIFLLMLIQWRSLKDSLLCMIPNLSPVLLIFIIMGALGIHLDMATAMIASVTVGIAIDDTIHIYHGFIHRVRRGIDPLVAIVRTYRQAGRAVMATTIILCTQFLLLVNAQFAPIANFGLLACGGLLAALLFDLLLLPALLIVIFRRNTHTVSI